jgi:hypothetical protein
MDPLTGNWKLGNKSTGTAQAENLQPISVHHLDNGPTSRSKTTSISLQNLEPIYRVCIHLYSSSLLQNLFNSSIPPCPCQI